MYAAMQQPPWRVVRAFPREDGGCLVHLTTYPEAWSVAIIFRSTLVSTGEA